jgi:hypothetical protein
MPLKDFVAASSRWLRQHSTLAVGSVFIAAVTAGSLACVSCAHTEAGLAREETMLIGTSNVLASVKQIAPYVPPPCNQILEGVLAVGGALMALWATHLQRSLADLRNGKSPAAPSASPPPAKSV